MICLFILLIFTPSVVSDGVFGCGGFIKSEVDINFSLVMLKLYTPHGSIKYQTDCAPNTGYYLIPLYDKGDFILKAEPPKGWGFEPASVALKVDGETDPCSKGEDINFKFTGFSLTGMVVSRGLSSGPSGVKISLHKTSDINGPALATGVTEEGGKYSFSNVMPGEYTVVASHPKWKFHQGQAKVVVKKDNVDAGSEISIAGYDVTGEVSGDGLPMQNVNFVLFSTGGGDQKTQSVVKGCEAGAPKGFHSKKTKQAAVCYVVSGKDGVFTFPQVPSGSYHLVPFYKGEHIRFDVVPERLDFVVAQDSVVLQKKFEIAGFSVSGKVLDKQNGAGIPNVAILLDGKDQTKTSSDGSYQLENMKKGTYRLAAKADNIDFEEMSVAISPNTPQLPSIVAAGFHLCGSVVIDRVPEGSSSSSQKRRIIYFPEGKGSDASSMVTDSNGKFCAIVKPGKYVVRVHTSDAEVKSGLILSPSEKTVTVGNRPVLDVSFSQFQAKVSGVVKCMEKCQPMEIVLDPVGRSSDKQLRVSVNPSTSSSNTEASFSFTSVLPGKYKASVILDNWCWKERSVELEVIASDVAGIEFSHTGYILKMSVSHPITVNFAHNKKEKSVGAFQLDKGVNRFCLAHPGVYQLTPESCHKFDKDHYTYDTSNPLTLTLTALQHLVYGSVSTENSAVSDIVVTITSSVEDTPVTIGPLKVNTTATTAAKAKAGKGEPTTTVYSFSHWVRSGEKLSISAKSSDLLFYPHQAQIVVSGEACPGKMVELVGRKGVFVQGAITPVIEGVKVKVVADDDSMEPVVLVSDAQGKYKLGPLHSDRSYTVSAEKAGYVLTKEADSSSFRAFKLGEISIKVQGQDGQLLSGVLLSLSGEKQFRSNSVTGSDGALSITGLSPGEYFLRPMMKEYQFTPASQMITVTEGTTKKMTIQGTRVAYSVFGHVTSLNGEPESGVVVEALGTGTEECNRYQEESKTETNGAYRLRGLHPSCVYNIQLKQGPEVNAHIERSLPAVRPIKVERSDVYDVDMVAFRRMGQMDISGNVQIFDDAHLKHLNTLKIQLFAESHPDSPVHTVSLSKSTFFFLPSVPMEENKSYLLILTSSLSTSQFQYSLPEHQFVANRSHLHVTFDFNPKPRLLDQDLNHGSLLMPIAVLVFVALALNHKRVLPFVMTMIQNFQDGSGSHKSGSGSNNSPFGSPIATPSSAQFVSQSQSSSMSMGGGSGGGDRGASVGGGQDLGGGMVDASPIRKRTKPRKV